MNIAYLLHPLAGAPYVEVVELRLPNAISCGILPQVRLIMVLPSLPFACSQNAPGPRVFTSEARSTRSGVAVICSGQAEGIWHALRGGGLS